MVRGRQFAQQYANNYVETMVTEAGPHRLIQMLYEGAIKNLNVSKLFIQQKNFEKKSEHINKTLSILLALREGVDLDKGGDVAQNLYSLYDYCYRQVIKSSINDDVAILDEVLGFIKDLHGAWSQMPETYKSLNQAQIEKLGA